MGIGTSAKKRRHKCFHASCCHRSWHHDLSHSIWFVSGYFLHYSLDWESSFSSASFDRFLLLPKFTNIVALLIYMSLAGTGTAVAYTRCPTFQVKDCRGTNCIVVVNNITGASSCGAQCDYIPNQQGCNDVRYAFFSLLVVGLVRYLRNAPIQRPDCIFCVIRPQAPSSTVQPPSAYGIHGPGCYLRSVAPTTPLLQCA